MKNKNVLVTGGLGFIGSNLAIRLVKMGAKVTIIDACVENTGWNVRNIKTIKDGVKLIKKNINDKSLIKVIAKSEYIFNLAGVLSHVDAMKDPIHDLKINTVDQLQFLLNCLEANPDVKIIYTGTRNQYGRAKYLPVTEDHPFDPIDTNGISEVAGEMYHMLYWKLKGLKSTSLRLCNVFGPHHQMRHSRQGVLNWFIRKIILEERIQLMGTGMQIRDCVYVDDVVDALIKLATCGDSVWGEAFNIGSFPISLKEFVEKSIKIYGKGNYELVPFPEDRKFIEPGDYIANWDKLHKITNWKPRTSLEAALRGTFEYYEKEKRFYF